MQEESISSGFLSIDIKNSLSSSSGLTTVFVGGPNPSVPAPGYISLSADVDNIRLWWPPCPHSSDPSKCNPFAFLYPKGKNGARQPSSGIQDADVQMSHVAQPVLDAMFETTITNAEAKGLLVSLTFNGQISEGVVQNDVAAPEQVVPGCSPSGDPMQEADPLKEVCSGCPEARCAFGYCSEFDVDCVGKEVSNEEMVQWYADNGACICQDVDNCPQDAHARNCQCPKNLFRICQACDERFGVKTSGELCQKQTGPAAPGTPDTCEDFPAFTCPAELCQNWGCSCWDPASFSGVYGQYFTVDRNSGTATCETESSGEAKCPKGTVETDESTCCQDASHSAHVCKTWGPITCKRNPRGEVMSCDGTCASGLVEYVSPAPPGPNQQQDPFNCGITACCLDTDVHVSEEEVCGESAAAQSLVSCTVAYSDGQVDLQCTMDTAGADGATLEGTFANTATRRALLPPVNAPRSRRAARAKGSVREAKIAEGPSAGQQLDDEQLRALSLLLSNVSTAQPVGKRASNSKRTEQLLLPKARKRAGRRVNHGGDAAYDGGFALLKLQIEFASCGDECENVELMHAILETKFTNSDATAFGSLVSSGDYTFELLEENVILEGEKANGCQGTGTYLYSAYFTINTQTKKVNSLFDVSAETGLTQAALATDLVLSQKCCAIQQQAAAPG